MNLGVRIISQETVEELTQTNPVELIQQYKILVRQQGQQQPTASSSSPSSFFSSPPPADPTSGSNIYGSSTSSVTVHDVLDPSSSKTVDVDLFCSPSDSNQKLFDALVNPMLDKLLSGQSVQGSVIIDGCPLSRFYTLFHAQEGLLQKVLSRISSMGNLRKVTFSLAELPSATSLEDKLCTRGTGKVPRLAEHSAARTVTLEDFVEEEYRGQPSIDYIQSLFSYNKHQILNVGMYLEKPVGALRASRLDFQFISFVLHEAAPGNSSVIPTTNSNNSAAVTSSRSFFSQKTSGAGGNQTSVRSILARIAHLIESRSPAIPYYDSKVTLLLKPALCGQQPAAWICLLTPTTTTERPLIKESFTDAFLMFQTLSRLSQCRPGKRASSVRATTREGGSRSLERDEEGRVTKEGRNYTGLNAKEKVTPINHTSQMDLIGSPAARELIRDAAQGNQERTAAAEERENAHYPQEGDSFMTADSMPPPLNSHRYSQATGNTNAHNNFRDRVEKVGSETPLPREGPPMKEKTPFSSGRVDEEKVGGGKTSLQQLALSSPVNNNSNPAPPSHSFESTEQQGTHARRNPKENTYRGRNEEEDDDVVLLKRQLNFLESKRIEDETKLKGFANKVARLERSLQLQKQQTQEKAREKELPAMGSVYYREKKSSNMTTNGERPKSANAPSSADRSQHQQQKTPSTVRSRGAAQGATPRSSDPSPNEVNTTAAPESGVSAGTASQTNGRSQQQNVSVGLRQEYVTYRETMEAALLRLRGDVESLMGKNESLEKTIRQRDRQIRALQGEVSQANVTVQAAARKIEEMEGFCAKVEGEGHERSNITDRQKMRLEEKLASVMGEREQLIDQLEQAFIREEQLKAAFSHKQFQNTNNAGVQVDPVGTEKRTIMTQTIETVYGAEEQHRQLHVDLAEAKHRMEELEAELSLTKDTEKSLQYRITELDLELQDQQETEARLKSSLLRSEQTVRAQNQALALHQRKSEQKRSVGTETIESQQASSSSPVVSALQHENRELKQSLEATHQALAVLQQKEKERSQRATPRQEVSQRRRESPPMEDDNYNSNNDVRQLPPPAAPAVHSRSEPREVSPASSVHSQPHRSAQASSQVQQQQYVGEIDKNYRFPAVNSESGAGGEDHTGGGVPRGGEPPRPMQRQPSSSKAGHHSSAHEQLVPVTEPPPNRQPSYSNKKSMSQQPMMDEQGSAAASSPMGGRFQISAQEQAMLEAAILRHKKSGSTSNPRRSVS